MTAMSPSESMNRIDCGLSPDVEPARFKSWGENCPRVENCHCVSRVGGRSEQSLLSPSQIKNENIGFRIARTLSREIDGGGPGGQASTPCGSTRATGGGRGSGAARAFKSALRASHEGAQRASAPVGTM